MDPAPHPRRAPRRRHERAGPWRRRRLVAATLAVGVVLAATACVGKTGRNDDYVEPGSGQQGPSGRVVPVDGG